MPKPKRYLAEVPPIIDPVIITPDKDYNVFLNSLPPNQRYSGDDYNMKRYWELNNKPKDFNEALNRKMFELKKDGYHAGSVAYNKDLDIYEFMKKPNHPTVLHEIINYYTNPAMQDFRRNYKLDTTNNPYIYKRRK